MQGRRITEKLLSHLQDVTGKVAAIFSNTEKFGYLSSSQCFHNFANDVGRESPTHSSHFCVHDASLNSSKS